MRQLAVFPSNAVARWIDAELFEREREALERERQSLREPGATREQSARPRSPDIRVVGRLYLSRRAGLRYRPFERLSSLSLQRAS